MYVFDSNCERLKAVQFHHILFSCVISGAYVPLTEHGTIIVDGVLASCYASFNHQLAHFFLAPLRWWPSLLSSIRTSDSMPAYVYAVKEIGHFVLPSEYQNRAPGMMSLFSVL